MMGPAGQRLRRIKRDRRVGASVRRALSAVGSSRPLTMSRTNRRMACESKFSASNEGILLRGGS
jgi:hypothetical protein